MKINSGLPVSPCTDGYRFCPSNDQIFPTMTVAAGTACFGGAIIHASDDACMPCVNPNVVPAPKQSQISSPAPGMMPSPDPLPSLCLGLDDGVYCGPLTVGNCSSTIIQCARESPLELQPAPGTLCLGGISVSASDLRCIPINAALVRTSTTYFTILSRALSHNFTPCISLLVDLYCS